MSTSPEGAATFFKTWKSTFVGHLGLQSMSYRVGTPCSWLLIFVLEKDALSRSKYTSALHLVKIVLNQEFTFLPLLFYNLSAFAHGQCKTCHCMAECYCLLSILRSKYLWCSNFLTQIIPCLVALELQLPVLVQFCCIFAATKDKFGYFLKKLFHSSTSHTYHHNSNWTIGKARNYL